MSLIAVCFLSSIICPQNKMVEYYQFLGSMRRNIEHQARLFKNSTPPRHHDITLRKGQFEEENGSDRGAVYYPLR